MIMIMIMIKIIIINDNDSVLVGQLSWAAGCKDRRLFASSLTQQLFGGYTSLIGLEESTTYKEDHYCIEMKGAPTTARQHTTVYSHDPTTPRRKGLATRARTQRVHSVPTSRVPDSKQWLKPYHNTVTWLDRIR
jgi:hypothetical protein